MVVVGVWQGEPPAPAIFRFLVPCLLLLAETSRALEWTEAVAGWGGASAV